MTFRPLAAATLFAAAVFAGGAAWAAEPVEIVRVWTGYRDARSFVHISEYFTGEEEPGRAVTLRSRPDVREGFYFTIRLATHERGGLPDGVVVLQAIPPDAETAKTFEFPFAAESRRTVLLEVGLTGDDWTHGTALPLAWKVEIRDAAGVTLASRESFLWSKPDPTTTAASGETE